MAAVVDRASAFVAVGLAVPLLIAATWRSVVVVPVAATPEMIPVPAGSLAMGSEDGEVAERPVHRVTVSAFTIDRYETTNAEFTAFVGATRHVTDAERAGVGWHWDGRWREVRGADWRHPHGRSSSIEGLARHPVVQVSWSDARTYCAWRGKRLPTEAEWERAARAAGERTYPWGDALPRDGARHRASYGRDRCCAADAGDGYLFTAPVGSFPLGRSASGVHDLAGNVWEWVEDAFDGSFYAKSPIADPVNLAPTGRKVIRGGGWGNDAWGLRSTLRHANPPDIGLSMVGIRCVLSVRPHQPSRAVRNARRGRGVERSRGPNGNTGTVPRPGAGRRPSAWRAGLGRDTRRSLWRMDPSSRQPHARG